jgi:hypothetical protein
MNGEVWLDVPSVPGVLASSEGRVMHVPYRAPGPNGAVRSYGGTPHFGVWNKADGRFVVRIKNKTYKVHQLIAEAFHGPRPFEGAVAMHVDENAANNRPSNLKWGTMKENMNAPGFLANAAQKCRAKMRGERAPFDNPSAFAVAGDDN